MLAWRSGSFFSLTRRSTVLSLGSRREAVGRMRRVWLEETFPASRANRGTAKPMLVAAVEDARFSRRHADQAPPTFDARNRLSSVTARRLMFAGRHDTMPVSKTEKLRDGSRTRS